MTNRRMKPLLGTYVEIMAEHASGKETPGQVNRAIRQAFDAMEQVQKLMSFHDPASELSRLNTARGGQVLSIHPWLDEVLQVAQKIGSASDGFFNCNIGGYLVKAGLLPKHGGQFTSRHNHGEVEFVSQNQVRVISPVCIDLGGIAKGFAVDKAVEALKREGIQSGVVNAGGDLRVFGALSIPIKVRSVKNPVQTSEVGMLKNGAFAVSANYGVANKHMQSLEQTSSAIVLPENGKVISSERSYCVIANECIYADALTKVLALHGGGDHASFQMFDAKAFTIDI